MLKTEPFKEFFELFDSLVQSYKIAPQDTYNMDEKGFMIGAIQRSQVVVPMCEKEAFTR
jgi:hypothetical protein